MSSSPRWPNPPPKGSKCDATVDSGVDGLGAPVIYTCQELATETCKTTFNFEAWLCPDHVTKLVAKGQVWRNPKKFPPENQS